MYQKNAQLNLQKINLAIIFYSTLQDFSELSTILVIKFPKIKTPKRSHETEKKMHSAKLTGWKVKQEKYTFAKVHYECLSQKQKTRKIKKKKFIEIHNLKINKWNENIRRWHDLKVNISAATNIHIYFTDPYLLTYPLVFILLLNVMEKNQTKGIAKKYAEYMKKTQKIIIKKQIFF